MTLQGTRAWVSSTRVTKTASGEHAGLVQDVENEAPRSHMMGDPLDHIRKPPNNGIYDMLRVQARHLGHNMKVSTRPSQAMVANDLPNALVPALVMDDHASNVSKHALKAL